MVEPTGLTYQVPQELKVKYNLDPEDITSISNEFKARDLDKSGSIDNKELKALLIGIGMRDIQQAQVDDFMSKYDTNNDNVIGWEEFIHMFGIYRKKNPKVKPGKEGIGKHVIREEEVSAMSFMINNNFAETEIPEIAERIPIDPDSEDLFPQMADGLLLIHLTNKIDPEAIDLRSVNKYGPNMNAIAIGANINQALTAAKGYVKLVGINSQVFTHQNKGLVLATLTQMSRLIATGVIDLAHCEELYRLKFEDESIEDFNALKPEDILIRWVNHHLKEAGQERRIENLGKDIADSEAMTYVLSQLDKPPSNETEERLGRTNLNALQEEDLSKRGEECVEQSKLIGVKEVVRGKDLHKGNQKVNTLFVAEVFNTRHGLHPLTAEEKEKMGNDYKETEGSKEEKAFALWINSLQLENVQIERSLCRECADGIYLLKVCDFLTPGSVDWGKVYGTEPPMKLKPFDKKNGKLNNLENTENCVQAFDCCKSVLNSKMVGLGPSDIRDGQKKGMLAIIWQLARMHYLQILDNKTDKDVLAWASQTAGVELKGFNDSQLSDGKILIKLAEACDPGFVDWEIVEAGEDEEQCAQNAKYAIALARKLEVFIFCTYEDIVVPNKKMMLIMMAGLYDAYNKSQTKA